jgi:hypothetical protein
VFIAKEGDMVDRRYEVLRIGPNSVDVQDLIENQPHTLALQPSDGQILN